MCSFNSSCLGNWKNWMFFKGMLSWHFNNIAMGNQLFKRNKASNSTVFKLRIINHFHLSFKTKIQKEFQWIFIPNIYYNIQCFQVFYRIHKNRAKNSSRINRSTVSKHYFSWNIYIFISKIQKAICQNQMRIIKLQLLSFEKEVSLFLI